MIKSKKKFADCRLRTVDLFRILLTAYCLLVFTTEINPTIRYVSPTGNNIPPYLTWEDAANAIQDAINVCEVGDTVLVDNGTYYENLVINTPISLIGLSMDSTIIDGRGLGDYTITFNESGRIINFNLIGYGEGISGTRVIWAITQFTIIEVKNSKISKAGGGISCVGSSLFAENLFINEVINGITLLSGNAANFSISKSIVIVNQPNARGITIGFAENADAYITNNTILFTGTSNQGYGISIGASNKVYIHNNLLSRFSIFADAPQDTVFVKNNVFLYRNGIDSENDPIIIRNNSFVNNNNAIMGFPPYVDLDYNLFWNNQNDLYGLTYGDSDRVADPMFIKDTLPNPDLDFDYHLQAYSPAIDAGDPDILDIDGSRSDIGLYGGPLGQSYKYQNLPPKPPVNLSAVVDTNQILLKWNRNSEADTSHYNVYRDTVSSFTIDSTKLVSSPADTFYIEQTQLKPGIYVYKITCVDNQENESLPSEEILIDLTTGIDDYPITINDYFLYQNYPNPFNPSTKIGYKLKERGYVKLTVYDITGSLVSVLVNKEQEAGYYEVEFTVGNGLPSVPNNLASGIYLYRIEVIGEGRIPVYSDMKKMILIK